jgi:hypothetical protein
VCFGAFRPLAQKYIFSHIYLRCANHDQAVHVSKLYNILSLHPELALHVRNLVVELWWDAQGQGTSLGRIIQLLTNIRSVRLLGPSFLGIKAKWSSYTPGIRSAVLDLFSFPSLEQLSIGV